MMDKTIAQHILLALDDVKVQGLKNQQMNLKAAQIIRRIEAGELIVVEKEDD